MPALGGAEPLHRRDRRLDHAGERAAPAGMRGADHAGARIGQQHRPAIRSGDADGERPHAGDDGIGARPRVAGPGRFGDRHGRRMHLIAGEETPRRDAERRRHAGAVLRHFVRRVARAGAAVEARIEAVGHPAVAGEKAVADAGELQ